MGLSQAEAARRYDVPEPTISRWMARYRAEGPAAFEPRSRRPKSNPAATPPAVIEAILAERDRLTINGHDAGPETISWHLQQTRTTAPSRATIARILTREGRVRPEPKKKPKAAYMRFEAEQPNQCWQSDFTHYLLATGVDVEIITGWTTTPGWPCTSAPTTPSQARSSWTPSGPPSTNTAVLQAH